jgi:small subunit ribosomal protein S6
MRHYEIVLLIHPDQSEQVPNLLERYRTLLETNNGHIHRLEDWGRRQLAYQIKKVHKAHYILMNIECDNSILIELQNAFRFNDSVLRFVILQKNEAITTPSVLLKGNEEKASEAHVAEGLPELDLSLKEDTEDTEPIEQA